MLSSHSADTPGTRHATQHGRYFRDRGKRLRLSALGEAIEVELVQTGVVTSTSHAVTPAAHDYFMGASEWQAPKPDHPSSPLRGLHGQCFGVTESQGETFVGGGGYCTYEDISSDRLVTRWTPEKQLSGGVTRGEWQVFEGSGRWEGATGSGTYETVRTGSQGERSRKLTGTITLP